jgi:predicted phage baseplate assembly protein
MVKVTGGERVRKIQIDSAEWKPALPAVPEHLEIHVTPRGDFSRYTLSLVQPNSDEPLPELDPVLSRVDFSFKVECETDFDCKPGCACPPAALTAPELDYLARDYASFRQLMLDRLSLLAPQWGERNPTDLGIALVELLAYVGDYLSYRQDAIGTEAYLGTARRRVSVRRHTRLLDYAMHDGCNARAWVQVRVSASVTDGVVLPLSYLVNQQNDFLREESDALIVPPTSAELLRRPRFVTRLATQPVLPEHEFERLAGATRAEVFEPLERVALFREHNEIFFYTWGDAVCCLPRGATKTTLTDNPSARLRLRAGDVLVFAERIGPRTGSPADSDPARRHAVRLTRVTPEAVLKKDQAGKEVGRDPGPLQTDPVTGTAYAEIEWAEDDSLPFPFCVSARAEASVQLLTDVSIALGSSSCHHARSARKTGRAASLKAFFN